MAPKISIIVPCYNQAQYLDECLQSVLDQTYQDWECIIVNDGSPDNTEEVAKKWVEKDSRFKYLYKENGGVASARNLAIKNSIGEWILPLDGDDKIAEKYLELAEKEFKNSPDIVYCDAYFFGIDDQPFNLKKFSYQELLTNNIIFCSSFFRKDFAKKIGCYDESLKNGFEDWDFWITLLKNSNEKKVVKLEYIGFFYRRKEISRDVLINKDKEIKEKTFQKIYNKHEVEYFNNFGSFQSLLYNYSQIKKQVHQQKKTNPVKKIFKKIFK